MTRKLLVAWNVVKMLTFHKEAPQCRPAVEKSLRFLCRYQWVADSTRHPACMEEAGPHLAGAQARANRLEARERPTLGARHLAAGREVRPQTRWTPATGVPFPLNQ